MDEKYHEQASQLELDRRADALAAARRSLEGTGQDDCTDCGELIPRARRLAVPGAVRCISCQQRYERMSK